MISKEGSLRCGEDPRGIEPKMSALVQQLAGRLSQEQFVQAQLTELTAIATTTTTTMRVGEGASAENDAREAAYDQRL